MTDTHSDIAPPDFESWPPERRDRWFAAQSLEYHRRKALETPARLVPVAEPEQAKVSLISGFSVMPEKINWLWEGWLAAGKMHVLGGAPGGGKTTIALNLAATVSSGGRWPDGTKAPAGAVVIWSGEDDAQDTLAPRLIAAGADMSRVFFVGDVLDGGKTRSFDPAKDIERLGNAIMSAGGAALLIVDPVVSAISGDSHKNAEVRRALQPLANLAAQAGAALLGITHFSKGTAGRDPTERITGSLAFGALARVVMVSAKRRADAEDETPPRVLMRAKSNIGPDGGGFEYALLQQELVAYPGIQASHVDWGAPIEGSAREVLGEAESAAEADRGGGVSAASDFLRALLADGPMAANTVKAEATAAGLSLSSLRRAKEALGVIARRSGYGSDGGWDWELPA